MPEKQSSQAQTSQNSKNTWWIPVVIGIIMLFIPSGAFAAPVFFLLSIIMRKRKPKESPETSPNSPLPLINITP